MNILAQLIVSGIVVGMIYGVIAFGYQLTFATSKTLNFGQGEALMLGALVGLTTINFLIGQQIGTFAAYLLMLPIVLAFGLMQGAVVEFLGVRQAIRTKSEAGWIMATIALGIIFKNLAENIWGRDALRFPSPLPEAALSFSGIRIQPMEIAIVLGAVLGLKAFAVAIIGGLSSGVGVVVGGVILGVTENLTGYYISTGYKDVPGLVLLLLVLTFKPSGLFGSAAIKKV